MQHSGLNRKEVEAFFGIVVCLGGLEERKLIGIVDSRAAMDTCIEFAQEFERVYGGTDWDSTPTGYMGFVDGWAYEKITNTKAEGWELY